MKSCEGCLGGGREVSAVTFEVVRMEPLPHRRPQLPVHSSTSGTYVRPCPATLDCPFEHPVVSGHRSSLQPPPPLSRRPSPLQPASPHPRHPSGSHTMRSESNSPPSRASRDSMETGGHLACALSSPPALPSVFPPPSLLSLSLSPTSPSTNHALIHDPSRCRIPARRSRRSQPRPQRRRDQDPSCVSPLVAILSLLMGISSSYSPEEGWTHSLDVFRRHRQPRRSHRFSPSYGSVRPRSFLPRH